jgi:hypothetical protein
MALGPDCARCRARGLGPGLGSHSLRAPGKELEELRGKGSGRGFGLKSGSRSEIAPWSMSSS